MKFHDPREIEFSRRAKARRGRQRVIGREATIKEIEEAHKKKAVAGAIPVSKYFGIPGVYHLIRGDEIVYIGESACVYTRISEHIRAGEKRFDSFKIYRVDGSARRRKQREKHHIRQHAPILNIQHNPLMR